VSVPSADEGVRDGALPFRALACDYDGTLATHDTIAPSTLEALRRARAPGLRLVLVTGRTLFELTRACEHLDLFDAVVAENGAVLYFPADSAVRDEGPPPPTRLLSALDRRQVPFQVGRVIVGTIHDRRDAVVAALAEADVALELVANRAALMLLPAGISKGTGVVTALFAVGVAPEDALAIGDAENDLALFDACGWSACPEDALPEVKARVDWILPGADGEGVRRAIDERILPSSLPPPRTGRDQLQLGWTVGTGEPVEIPARGVNVLVQGDSLCGKSSLVGGLVERLAAAHERVCLFDPEGDYEVLDGLASSRLVEIARGEDWNGVVEALRTATPVIADLTRVPHAAKGALAGAGLALIHRLRGRTGVAHWTIVDEAHCLLHRDGARLERLALAARGVCLATYRASELHPAAVDGRVHHRPDDGAGRAGLSRAPHRPARPRPGHEGHAIRAAVRHVRDSASRHAGGDVRPAAASGPSRPAPDEVHRRRRGAAASLLLSRRRRNGDHDGYEPDRVRRRARRGACCLVAASCRAR
jgi:hypothetical protein